jgi:hypothetical protein
MEAATSIAETPSYTGVDRRRHDRRSGTDRRAAASARDEAGPVTVAAPTGGRTGVRGSVCRRCVFAHPRSDERGGVRLCVPPEGGSGLVIGDQHACTRFALAAAG